MCWPLPALTGSYFSFFQPIDYSVWLARNNGFVTRWISTLTMLRIFKVTLVIPVVFLFQIIDSHFLFYFGSYLSPLSFIYICLLCSLCPCQMIPLCVFIKDFLFFFRLSVNLHSNASCSLKKFELCSIFFPLWTFALGLWLA